MFRIGSVQEAYEGRFFSGGVSALSLKRLVGGRSILRGADGQGEQSSGLRSAREEPG